ncbi:MAG: hypothetical protein SX243_23910 [Acidobacteriota bacterium]|nr:hypothetical protein [Acidobacteriota bacterium]
MKTFHRALWITGLALLCAAGLSAAEAPQLVDLPEAQLVESSSCLEGSTQASAVAPNFTNPVGDVVLLGSTEECIEQCFQQRDACCAATPGICDNFPNPCQTQYFQCSFGC